MTAHRLSPRASATVDGEKAGTLAKPGRYSCACPAFGAILGLQVALVAAYFLWRLCPCHSAAHHPPDGHWEAADAGWAQFWSPRAATTAAARGDTVA